MLETETAPPPRRPAWWVETHPREAGWILAGVALLLRLIYLFQISRTPFYRPDRLDPLFYFNWAREIAAGHWIGDRIFVQSPLYAYVVALFLKVLGEHWVLPILPIFQALAGVGTCLLIVRVGKRVLDPRSAWVGGLAAALYGPFLFYEGMVMKTFLSTFLTVYLVDLLLRSGGARRGLLLLAGLVFALTSLVRDNFVLLFPLLLAGLFFAFREMSRRERLRACLLFTAGAALGILPVTIRNYAVGHEFALLTTGGGEVFYIGNNADANGRYLPPPFVHADPDREHDDFIAKAGELSGRKLTPGESSAFWLRQGLSWIGSNPGGWLRLLARKLIIFWNAYELPDNYNYYVVRQVLLQPLSLPGIFLFVPLSLITFGLVTPLGLVGVALTWRRWRDLLLVYLVLFGYMGTVLLFFNFSRFRVPILPFLCLFAGATVVALADEVKSWLAWFRSPRAAAVPSPWTRYFRKPRVLAFPALFLLFAWSVNFVGTGGRGVFPTLQMERELGDTYRLQGRFAEAEREYRRGLQILGDEPMDPATAASLGVDPARMRQEVENERMAQGVNFAAVRGGLHFGLGALWVDRGKEILEQDRGKGEDLIRRGLKELEAAVRAVPHPSFLRRLAEAYSLLRLSAEAEKTYRSALGLAPGDFGLRYDLAGLYYETGRYPEALLEMREAKKGAKTLSAYELSDYHYGLGLLWLDGFQQRGKALYHLRKALEANPGHREAKRIRELVAEISAGGTRPEVGD
jgi:tetratricopeptide (TPR) repeat protein